MNPETLRRVIDRIDIIPRSKGGTGDMANLAISHTACNARRGNGGGEA